MKAREPRQKVMIKARMRVSATWNDVCILNISARGMSLQAAAPPPRGTYLEVRRGAHEILARVVWVNHHRFGVRTQESLDVDAVINQPDRSAAPALAIAAGVVPDRRRAPRSLAERHECSRMLSRAMEFAVIGIFAASAAVAAFGTVSGALERPLAQVSAAIAPK
jgi:hypothetical protein